MSIATRIQAIEEHISNAYDSLSKLGVTADNKNIENISELVDQIYENAPKTDYVSGIDLTIDNTLKGKIDYKDTDTIEKIGFGNTSQTETTGKNLFNKDNKLINAGISSGGVINTANNNDLFYIPVTYGNNYTVSFVDKGVSGNILYGFSNDVPVFNGSCTYNILDITTLNNHTFTPVNSNNKYLCMRLNVVNTNQYLSMEKIQVEQGSSSTSYEPYTGGIASPNPSYPQEVKVVKDNQNVLIQNQNIMRINKTYPYTDRAVTYDYSNGQFVLSGTSNNNNIYMVIYQPGETPLYNSGDTITVMSETNWNDTSRIEFLKSNSSFLIGVAKNKTQTITFTEDCYGYRVWYNATDSKDFTGIYQKIQIEKGTTTPTEYISYQENNYEINLSSKNLLNNTKSTTTLNGLTFTINNDKSITITGTATSQTDFYLVGASSTYDNIGLNAGTYNLSGCINGSSSTYMLIATRKNSSGTTAIYPVSTSSDGIAITVENDYTFRIFIRVINGTTMNTTIYPQLEKGSTATSYAPYFTPIELCQIEQYQDYIYKNNGNWFIHKKIGNYKFNGSEGWARSGNTSSTNFVGVLTGTNLTNKVQAKSISGQTPYLSDYFAPTGSLSTTIGVLMYNPSNNIYGSLAFSLDINSVADLTSFQTWLSNNNVTLYYILATPTETQITDATLISQLNAWYNAQSMDDITHITVDGDLPMQLKLRALKK